MRKSLIGILCGLGLTGCVMTSTNQIDERTIVISAHGGIEHTMGDVQQAAFSEAAKAAKKAGFRYFAVLGTQDATRHGAFYNPGQTTSNTTFTPMAGGVVANTTSSTSPGFFTGVVMPGESMTIRYLKEGEFAPNTPGVWDADSILSVQAKK